MQELAEIQQHLISRITRWQDEQTLDYTCITDLHAPLVTLLDLFASFQIKNEPCVESTLKILKKLLDEYDKTFDALVKAKDLIATLDKRFLANHQLLDEFKVALDKKLASVRSAVSKDADQLKFTQGELLLLRNSCGSLQKKIKAQDDIVFNMAQQLNDSEHENISLHRDKRRLELQVCQLKTELKGVQQWRQKWKGLSQLNEQPRRSLSRERSLAYSQELDIRHQRCFINNIGQSNGHQANPGVNAAHQGLGKYMTIHPESCSWTS
jgi:hypothetical protein